jgi:hypothetical protein
MAVQWQLPDGSTLLHAGGVWDKADRCYLKREPDRARVIRLKESQVLAAQWLAWWLQERAEGRKRDIRSLFLLGDRGGGKTFLATVGTVTALLKFPSFSGKPTLAWQVVASYKERRELEREIADCFPFEGLWYTRKLAPEHEYRFVNGALLVTQSGDNPEALRQGTVDFLYLNEATKLVEDAYIAGIPRLKDHDGLCIATTNPPRSNRGRWVKKLYDTELERKAAGEMFSVHFVRVESAGNDILSKDAADDVADQIRVLNPRAAAADIDGKMLAIDQPAYWEFNPVRNIRPLPDLGDITREFLRQRTGRAYDYLGGMDFQGNPHMAAVLFKIYGTQDSPILWAVDDIILEQATEEDLAQEALEQGYSPNNALWIGDASGQWQDGAHPRACKVERDSFKVIRSFGFHILPPVRPKSSTHRPKNPPVEQRVKLTNKCLAGAQALADKDFAPRLIEAWKECILRLGRYGRVVPLGYYSHLTDAAGYPIWWVFGKARPTIGGSIGETVSIERRSPIG